jgi:serine/threonine-protein kinase RsbW
MEDAQQVRLEVPSAPEYVSLVRQTIENIAYRMHFRESEIDDLKLAIGEACNNAVRHGCPSSAHPYVTVICTMAPDALEIEISNGLAGGEACPVIVGKIDGDKEGGMGLYIMRKIMDEVQLCWEGHTARVRMVKRIKMPQGV